MPNLLAFPWPHLRRLVRGFLLAAGAVPVLHATPLLHQVSATVYQTEHCIFIIDSSVTWASPQTAYNDIYAAGPTAPYFPRLQGYYDTLVANSAGQFFSVCYIANTGYSQVPNYIDRTFKADGINETYTAGTPYTYPTVDMCRYNLPGGNVTSPVLAVFDHELGHAWGARAFYTFGQPSLSDGHWLPNSTVDCQMSGTYSSDGGVTVNKLYGDPGNGFRYRREDNAHSNDYAVFSEQTLYLLGVRETWPTSYVLNNPVYNADRTAGFSSYLTFDHAAMISTYGPRSPDYTTSQKHFKIGFVYIARDLAEVNTVYANVEYSANAFCNAETIDTIAYRSQTPFLCDTKYRASADSLLADLDGNATPTLSVTNPYVTSTDGSAAISFTAADADGPVPAVSVVPASTSCWVVGSTVQVSGLPDGVHFFTLRAMDAGGKKVFAHFTVEVHRPVTSTAIATQPLPVTVTSGATASFSVTASGSPATFTYQWFRKAARTSTWNALVDGGAYCGSATATLLVATGTDQDGDNFLCLVTNATGSATSAAVELAVNEALPVLTAQPADAAVPSGQSVPFTVAAIGAPTTFGYFHYQWQISSDGGVNWSDLVNGAPYTSCTSATLHVQSNLAMSGYKFRCQVSDTAGMVTSNIASLTVGSVPVVTTQPVSVSTSAGQSASFTVVVSGTGPLAYLWSNYSTPVSGGTSATLTLTNVQASDIGAYTVFVTNAYGSTRSNVGTLAVSSAAPSFTAQPQDATAAAGQGVTFGATAVGTNPFTYQWKKNGVNIAGATGATYTINHVVAGNAGVYTVVVTNSVNSATSSGGTLTVTSGVAVPHDFNSDGKPDLMLENTTTGQRTLWLMNGTVLSSTISYGTIPAAWRVAATTDFNHDAQIDIVWENTVTGDHAIWLMNGTVFSSAIDFGVVPTQWRLATVGDFNNDGDPDFFWENTVTGDRALWLMHGTVFSSAIFFGTVSTDWRIAAAGDFDADGKPDLIWENTVTGQRALWLMNGTLFTSGVSLGIVSTDWRIAAAGDFDADGQTDIVWENTVTGQRQIWLMNGTTHTGTVDLGIVTTDWRIAD